MVSKVVYIGYQPLTEKVRNDFYFDSLASRGFGVEYWDLSRIYFPGLQKDVLNGNYIIKHENFSQLEHSLAGQKSETTVFVIMVTYEGRVLKLFRLLTKYKCFTIFFARGVHPLPSTSAKSLFIERMKLLKSYLASGFLKNKLASFYKKIGLVKTYDIIFSAGELGVCSIGGGFRMDKAKAKLFDINSFDFDQFMSAINCENMIGGRYCVFLDEYLPHHPDFFLFGINTVDPKEYYSSMNDFFGRIEGEFKMPVVIAAHPKAEKYFSENPFEGRKMFFSRTAELAKYAQFALIHCSTSVNFPVLNNCPMLFLYTDSIKEVMPDYYQKIALLSVSLNCDLVNVDLPVPNNLNVNRIDLPKYEDYRYKYLTSRKSEHTKSVDIFCDQIYKL